MKAQIFLSCGQNSEERPIAQAIKEIIEHPDSGLGFDCFVASEQQDLTGLRETVFKRLEEADYFIFIDFRREELKQGGACRGSLWANQELAVASYIGLGDCVLLVQEEGVEKRGGMLNAVLANHPKDRDTTFPSSDKNVTALSRRVCQLIKAKLNNKEWTNQTRNKLALSIYPHSKYLKQRDGRVVRPFHIQVENLHHRKDARNCFAYLDGVFDLNSNQDIYANEKWETVEFKWAHTSLAAVRIAPKSHRYFDAVWLFQNPNASIEMSFFNYLAPSQTDYYPHALKPGKYRLTFAVVSDNFVVARRSFAFEFGQTLESGKLF
jgi:hypothetical protein